MVVRVWERFARADSKKSVKLRVEATTFAGYLEAYKLAPMDYGKGEQVCLNAMLKTAKSHQEFFIIWIESKGCFAGIAGQAEAEMQKVIGNNKTGPRISRAG